MLEEVDDLLKKGLIRPSKSPWSSAAKYVNNLTKKENAKASDQLESPFRGPPVD